MRIGFGAVAVLVAWIAPVMIRRGVAEWRNAPREPVSAQLRYSLFDAETRAAFDRGGLIFGVALGGLAIALAVGAVAGSQLGKGTAWGTACVSLASVGFAIFFAGCGLFGLTLNFNWPKFLVPPHHRRELGAFASRRRRRRESETAGPFNGGKQW